MASLDKLAILSALRGSEEVYSRCRVTGRVVVCRRPASGLFLNEQDRAYGFQVREVAWVASALGEADAQGLAHVCRRLMEYAEAFHKTTCSIDGCKPHRSPKCGHARTIAGYARFLSPPDETEAAIGVAQGPEGFDAIIAAMKIFGRYGNKPYPFHCEHDTLFVDVDYGSVSKEDREALESLGFEESGEHGAEGIFLSFRFGSC